MAGQRKLGYVVHAAPERRFVEAVMHHARQFVRAERKEEVEEGVER